MTRTLKADVVIIGAGAAGLMCAIEAGKRGRHVMVIDHANKPGKKILMSGGGRCNFTNYHINFDSYISHNPHFCKSALSRYTQWDFIDLVKKHQISFHEKTLGQLFCDYKSRDILDMLLLECEEWGVKVTLNTAVNAIEHVKAHHYKLHTHDYDIHCESLVIASGGLSIPTMGASPFGYKVAEQFTLNLFPTRAGLVPFTLHQEDKQKLSELSGIAVDCLISSNKASFEEAMLFTHRGLSGPAVLQVSSYWKPSETVDIYFLPKVDILQTLTKAQQSQQQVKTLLSDLLPKRVVACLLDDGLAQRPLNALHEKDRQHIAGVFQPWQIKPNGTEGYRTAEVTLGGVDTREISSKTFECHQVPGLYFIGEVLDVTGWLGGYNFQWAWSSGWAAGQVV